MIHISISSSFYTYFYFQKSVIMRSPVIAIDASTIVMGPNNQALRNRRSE